MKNIVYALILSLTIHILFLLILNEEKIIPLEKIKKEKQQKQVIRYVKLKKIISPIKEPQILKKPLKEKELNSRNTKLNFNKKTEKNKISIKKVSKNILKKPAKRDTVKKAKKTEPKPSKKIVVKPTYTQKLPKKIQKIVRKKVLILNKPDKTLPTIFKNRERSLDKASKKVQEDTLESFLSTPIMDNDLVDPITKKYLDLYGDEFKSFTKVQKVYLKRNLKAISSITKSYMMYPRISIRTKQMGTNVIEFTLFPNGDISSVILSTSSGYEALDDESVNAVEIAYQDYPRPRKATKIKIHINYLLY